MKIDSLPKLFEEQIQDLHSAENQLVKALKKMADAASTDALKQAFATHLEETKVQIERLEQIGKMLSLDVSGKKCKAMEGLIEEGKEVLDANGAPPLLDLAMIAAAQRVEHYEISGYGTARTLAEHLGHTEAANLLRQTEDEEAATDKKLTRITLDAVLPQIQAVAQTGKG